MPAKGQIKNIAYERYGRLVALEPNGRNRHRQTLWLCQCDCGNFTTVTYSNLASQITKSCGCLKQENGGANSRQESLRKLHQDDISWYETIDGYMRGDNVNHPLRNKANQVWEHWHNFWLWNNKADWVLRAKNLGATLHHKNCIRTDNRAENLELRWPGRHPQGWTTEEMINVIESMGYTVEREK